MKYRSVISILLLASASPLFAATMMEITNEDGSDSRIWINDNFARIDEINKDQKKQTDAMQPEMIIDIKNKKLYGIDHKSKILMDMTNFSVPGQPKKPPMQVNVSFDKQGTGPDIAGFSTQQYVVSANGKKCFNAMFSKDILKHKNIVAFYETMMNAVTDDAGNSNACDAADNQITKESVTKYGIAVKVLDTTGKTIFEIKKIKEDATPPSNYLELPAGYKKKSMMEMMQQQMQMQAPPK